MTDPFSRPTRYPREPYDMRSNIKGKPGSQGTLFQVADKGLLNPQQRWPKGYTPERQEAVRSALKDTVITGPGHVGTPNRDQKIAGRYAVYPEAERKATSAIARSTMPTEHLAGLERIHDNPDPDTHGTYWPARRELGLTQHVGSPGKVPGRKSQEDVDKTLIHEIGHHVDNLHTHETNKKTHGIAMDRVGPTEHQPGTWEFTEHAIRAATDTHWIEPGVAEAVADNYVMKHYRGPGRKAKPTTQGVYQETRTSDVMAQKYPGYNEATDNPPNKNLGPQFRQEKLF